MILAHLAWPEVGDLDRRIPVLIPTGSIEQHGPHLPLGTDTILVTAVAEEVERRMPRDVILAPGLWLGASGHHLAFPGTLSADFGTYVGALTRTVLSLARHGFEAFLVLNGHGGNAEPNGVALRQIKEDHPRLILAHTGYYQLIPSEVSARALRGPLKEIRHACEAETSLMLHVRPDLVRLDRCREDGLASDPPVPGLVTLFDEITEEGSWGYAPAAEAETGRILFEAAVEGAVRVVENLRHGIVFRGIGPSPAEA